jgi:hypothetical protein
VTSEQRQADNQGVTEDDVNEIKQDISAFRCEILEVLKNSGMNVPGYGQGKKCVYASVSVVDSLCAHVNLHFRIWWKEKSAKRTTLNEGVQYHTSPFKLVAMPLGSA